MKNKHFLFIRRILKTGVAMCCMLYGFAAHAQAVVGKWKLTAAKETVTDKASGKTQDLGSEVDDLLKMFEQTIEFHADNTYFMQNKMVKAAKGLEVTGKYSISGNQLKLEQGKSNMPVTSTKSVTPTNNSLPPVVTVVSSSASTLVLQYGTTTTSSGKTFTINIVNTYTKQ